MTQQPAATVIVVTHDSAGDIEGCLASLAAQQDAPPFETVVVDNGSRDGTPALVRRAFPQVRVVEQENMGFGAGNNSGARQARGPVLVFLNPDTVAEPRFVAELVRAVGPGQAATAQVALRNEPALVNTWGNDLHFTGYAFVRGYRQARLPPGPPLPVPAISGAAFAMLRADFDAAGGFDEDFFLYMEDVELSWRLRRRGVAIVLAPSAVAVHDYALDVPPRKVDHLETGRLLLLRKHLPPHLWVLYLPSLVLAELMAWGWALRLGGAGVRAKARALRRGWRRGVRRWDLPRARPHRFARRTIPFGLLGKGWALRAGGLVANLAFGLNTLAWPLRRRRP